MSIAILPPAGDFGDWERDLHLMEIEARFGETAPEPRFRPDPDPEPKPEGRIAYRPSRAAERRQGQQDIEQALYGPRHRKSDREG